MFVFCVFFYILCILCFRVVLFIVSPVVNSCLFPIFEQVYRPMPPGGKPIAVNKYIILFRGAVNTSQRVETHLQ